MIRHGSIRSTLRATLVAIGLAALATPLAPSGAGAQWSTVYEQFYLQAPHNWEFRNRYQGADRLFNAFDYGHAILYETLWRHPDAPASRLEEKEYDFLTKRVLVKPPRVPLEEAAIEVMYARLAPEAKTMFEWAHILHRQLYDVLADETLSPAQKDAEVARVIAYYRTRPDVAFSSRPKSMKLMQEQPYSLAFRRQYPKFNGLIWAYHWLQIGLYEPLLVGKSVEERQAGVRATTARFWQMLAAPTRTMPYQMPMTAAVAPEFARRYTEAAIIFDNLHSMHDVISDILANDSVPRNRKRAEILRAAERFRDDTSYVMTVDGWLAMSGHMGVENMGGPAVGFTPALPEQTVTYGAVMTHDDSTGEMLGFRYGQATGGEHAGMPGMPQGDPQRGNMQHGAASADSGDAARPARSAVGHGGKDPATDTGRMDHAAMGHRMPRGTNDSTANDSTANDSTASTPTEPQMLHSQHMRRTMELHEHMMADPVIRQRMLADTALRRMMGEMMESMPPEHGEHREQMRRAMDDAPAATPRRPARRAAPSRPAARDPHAGHDMSARPAATPPRGQIPDPRAGHHAPAKRPAPAAPDTSAHRGHRP
jgi:hypothetical protein